MAETGKWTKGGHEEWTVDGPGSFSYQHILEDGECVAIVVAGYCEDATLKRRVDKIAAAPEMAEALDHVEAVMSIVQPRSHTGEYLETLKQVRAALRKARGEQP